MSKTVGIARFNRNCPTQTVVLKHIARLLVRCLFRLPRWWDIKKVAVEEISAAIANAQTLVVAEYRGISVSSMTELRANARKEGVYLRVLKNTLARRAVEGTSFAALADQMVGPLVYAASEDAVAAAKVLHQFAKKDDKIVVKAGSYNGEVMNAAQVAELASIPSREELLSKLLFVMQAPVSGFARGLAALAEKKAGEEAA